MSSPASGLARVAGKASLAVIVLLAAGEWNASQAQFGGGGGFGRFSAVGGIAIDADGVVRNQTADELGGLREARADALRAISGDLKQASDMRMISLRRLDALLAEHGDLTDDRPDEARFLAGLQRIQYVFVFPELNDIVLAGPAEGWKVNKQGHVVGITTGRPVLMLDDLLVALRSAEAAASGGLTCSIDPTAEGLNRLQAFAQTLSTVPAGGPAALERLMEQALGTQNVTIAGVPADSHFARVMFAADYRMKRLAMAIDPPTVRGLPSYIQTVAGGKGVQDIQQRWWLSTNYDALLRSPDSLAWEIRGQGVKCMTEDELLVAGGGRQRTGQANPAAQRWADMMTANYEELSLKEPIFGDLRNVMDLAVVAALITKENLANRAGVSLPYLVDESKSELTEYLPAPRQVPTIAKAVKKGRNFIFSASGGIEIPSWQVVEQVEESDSLASVIDRGAPAADESRWWWDAAPAAN
jgi:hypothetical protein